jgi:peptide/nickel transport system ATP-binding protein
VELRIPILYITHDLTTAYHVSDYIIVMYKGAVMEAGDVERIIRDPKHPYTQLLVNSIPWPDPEHLWGEAAEENKRSSGIYQEGCRFADRCPHVFEPCTKSRPGLFKANDNQVAACFLYQNNEILDGKDLGTLFAARKAG